ncbi:uncharacterized protein LOC144747621 [Ciona intestinalis]
MVEEINERISSSIGCRMLVENDQDEVDKLMLNSFAAREPITQALNPTHKDLIDFHVNVWAKNYLTQGASFGAYKVETGELIATILMGIPCESKEQKFNDVGYKMTKFLNDLNLDLPDEAKASRCASIAVVTVREDYCNKGIMTALWDRCKLIGKAYNCIYLTSECTSLYTQKVAKKLGYCVLNNVKYSEYTDEATNEKWFASAKPPHLTAQMVCLKLV